MTKATITLYLDTRNIESEYGVVKILCTFKRKQRLYSTGVKLSINDWTKLQRNIDEYGLSSKLKDKKFIEIYNRLYDENSLLQKAKNIIEPLADKFTFEDFKFQLKNDSKIENKINLTNNVIQALKNRNKALLQEDKIGSANLYLSAANSLTRFLLSLSNEQRYNLGIPIETKPILPNEIPSISLTFDQITTFFLKEYEKWMLKCGKISQKKNMPDSPASSTVIGIYLRHLRTVYNEAISNGIVKSELYPFKKKGYVIPAGRSKKKALLKEDILKIMTYEAPSGSFEERSRDLWVFSYLSNGMNFSDICHLTWGDIDGDKATFVRKKTIHTKKSEQKKVCVSLFLESWAIINRWGNSDKNEKSFVFPFLDSTMDEKRKIATIKQVIKITNKWVNRIAQKLGIEGDVNTYHARHSFATILLRSNAPIAFISKSLGHSNIQTTEAYLGDFEDEQVQEYLKALL